MAEPGAGEAARLDLLGLARRAGRAVVGTRAVGEAARSGRLTAAIVAADATENARRRIGGVLRRERVRVLELADRARLGAAVGKGPVAIVGLVDAGFAARLFEVVDAAERARAGERRMLVERPEESRR